MNIVREYAETYVSKKIAIKEAEYAGDFTIKILFADGREQLVDFKNFLSKAQHPDILKYKNEESFKTFRIVDGNLDWNDYEMIFPLSDLYAGIII